QGLGVVQQPPDQGALAIVHAAARDEPQQPLGLVPVQVAGDVRRGVHRRPRNMTVLSAGSAIVIRNSLPASFFPSTRPGRGRSPGPGAPTWWPAASRQ